MLNVGLGSLDGDDVLIDKFDGACGPALGKGKSHGAVAAAEVENTILRRQGSQFVQQERGAFIKALGGEESPGARDGERASIDIDRERRRRRERCAKRVVLAGSFPLVVVRDTGLLLVVCTEESRDRLVDHGVGAGTHLVVGLVLDGMGNKGAAYLWQSKLDRLCLGRIFEGCGGEKERGSAVDFEPGRVVHTARGAGSSVGERFDNEVAFLLYLAEKRGGRRLGEGGLAVALDGDVGSLVGDEFGEAVDEDIAARLGDVEQTDGAAEGFWSRGELPLWRAALVGRIEDLHHGRPPSR